MSFDGKDTTYKNDDCGLGDGFYCCFTHITVRKGWNVGDFGVFHSSRLLKHLTTGDPGDRGNTGEMMLLCTGDTWAIPGSRVAQATEE